MDNERENVMSVRHQLLTITAVTEVECCNGRTLEAGHLEVGTLHCPLYKREAWMAAGYTAKHDDGASFFVPNRRALRHLVNFRWSRVTNTTEGEAQDLLNQARAA